MDKQGILRELEDLQAEKEAAEERARAEVARALEIDRYMRALGGLYLRSDARPGRDDDWTYVRKFEVDGARTKRRDPDIVWLVSHGTVRPGPSDDGTVVALTARRSCDRCGKSVPVVCDVRDLSDYDGRIVVTTLSAFCRACRLCTPFAECGTGRRYFFDH